MIDKTEGSHSTVTASPGKPLHKPLQENKNNTDPVKFSPYNQQQMYTDFETRQAIKNPDKLLLRKSNSQRSDSSKQKIVCNDLNLSNVNKCTITRNSYSLDHTDLNVNSYDSNITKYRYIDGKNDLCHSKADETKDIPGIHATGIHGSRTTVFENKSPIMNEIPRETYTQTYDLSPKHSVKIYKNKCTNTSPVSLYVNESTITDSVCDFEAQSFYENVSPNFEMRQFDSSNSSTVCIERNTLHSSSGITNTEYVLVQKPENIKSKEGQKNASSNSVANFNPIQRNYEKLNLSSFKIKSEDNISNLGVGTIPESYNAETKLTTGVSKEPKIQVLTPTIHSPSTVTHKKLKKESVESKREKKAAKTLAIITGAFVVCWLPFFVTAVVVSIFPDCMPSDKIFSFFLWLGYFNSTLNPIIYTIFSPEFREAFKRILCGQRNQRYRPGKYR